MWQREPRSKVACGDASGTIVARWSRGLFLTAHGVPLSEFGDCQTCGDGGPAVFLFQVQFFSFFLLLMPVLHSFDFRTFAVFI